MRRGAIEQVEYGSNYNIYWSQTGVLRSRQVRESVDVQFRNRWSSGLEYTEKFKRFEQDFRIRQIGLQVGCNTPAYQTVRLGYEAPVLPRSQSSGECDRPSQQGWHADEGTEKSTPAMAGEIAAAASRATPVTPEAAMRCL